MQAVPPWDVPGVRLPCNARVVPGQWDVPQWNVPEWEEPPEAWTVIDDAQLAAIPTPGRCRYPWHQRVRHALVRTLAAPLTVARLRRAGWKRRGWRSWEPPAS
jgi:hypothetical protein